MISFGDALKAFRRGVHVYGPDWRGAVLCERREQALYAIDEATRIFNASSLIPTYNASTNMFVFDPSGAKLLFCTVTDSIDTYMLRGYEFTQLIWLYRPVRDVERDMQTMWHSTTVPEEKLRIDYSSL